MESFLGDSDSKESAENAGDLETCPGSGKIPRRREWVHIPAFLTGEFRGQRSPMGYSPWGRKRVRHDWAAKQQQQGLQGPVKEK